VADFSIRLALADDVAAIKTDYPAIWRKAKLHRGGQPYDPPGLAFGDGADTAVELGPLSLVAVRGGDAALIRLIPKFPGQTEVEIVQMPRNGAVADDGIGEALRDGDALDGRPLDRGFYDWYWPLMAPPTAA